MKKKNLNNLIYLKEIGSFSGGPVVKNSPCNARDTGPIPGWEEPTCRGAVEPVHRNYRACMPRAHALQQEKPPQWEALALQRHSGHRLPQLEKAHEQQQRLSTAKNKYIFKKRNWINNIKTSHKKRQWTQMALMVKSIKKLRKN